MCGQYHILLNLDTQEYIDPREMGSGQKLFELCMNDVSRLLPYLLSQSANASGGDPRIPWGEFEQTDGSIDWETYHKALDEAFPNCGRWAGDRITVVGDYDESGLYHEARDSHEYTEITAEIREEVLAFLDPDGFMGIHLGQNRAQDSDADPAQSTLEVER
jgi:hypothetical protein